MPSKEHSKCCVLYVEDTPGDQQILREAITFAAVPVQLVTASTADRALQLLTGRTDFHVVLLDWNLPVVTGVEFLTAIRGTQPDIPVFILTGEPGTVDAPAAAKLGAGTIIRKPLTLDQWEQLAVRIYDHCGEFSAVATATAE